MRRARVAPGILGPAPPEILRGSGATVYGQIEDWLAEAIGAGRLAPGDRMPSEQDLAAGRRKEFAPIIAPAGDDAPLVTERGSAKDG